ncbi:MAG: DUF6046 domain-containing protein [Oscillibacter sp.]|nr:DUF6046 domain-containing protein [Oscillibacter sp.]
MKFDILQILEDVAGYKGLPYPGVWFPKKGRNDYQGEDFIVDGTAETLKTHSNKGTTIYKKDALGNYYFMPVTFVHNGKEYEIPCALVSITGRKNIIETPLVGRQGSVKELISLEDYRISITGAIVGENEEWPEEGIEAIQELYGINEAIELKCALTDIFLSESDKVVISELNLPSSGQTEHVQVVEITCITDRAFELIME